MLNSPCKGCEKLFIKCHSTCEEYLEFREEVDELREKIRKEKNKYPCQSKVTTCNKRFKK